MVNITRQSNHQDAEPARDGQGAFRFGDASRTEEDPPRAPSNPTFTFSPPTAPPISRRVSQGSLFSVPATAFFSSAALSTAPPLPAARARAASAAPVFTFGGMSESSTGVHTPSSTSFTFSATPGATPQPSQSPSPLLPSSPRGTSPLPPSLRRAASDTPVITFGPMSDSGASAHTPSSTPFTLRSRPRIAPLASPSPSPQPATLLPGQLPLPSSPRRAASSSPVASFSPLGGTRRDALLTQSSPSIVGRHGTRSPRERSPSLGVGIAGLSIRDAGPEEPQYPRGRSPSLGADVSGFSLEEEDASLGLDVSGLSLGEDPDDLTPYDVDSEEMPPHQFFSAVFQRTLQGGVSIAQRTVAVIDRLTSVVGSNDTLSHLREDAERLSSFRPADMKTIAVLGHSGEGKSSLINSLLNLPRLAHTGDIGSACTSVVTEYHQKGERQSAPIHIEVECMPQVEIEELLSELLHSYRQLFLPSVQSDSIADEDYARCERESARAWSALEAAFGHKPQFREDRFRDVGEGSLERNTAQLIEWSREVQWPEGVTDGRWTSMAESAEECRHKTLLFMRDQCWPFTKVIRIYVDAQVLRTGVVLVDLPGLGDTNLARVRATQDYLMRCDNIFIAANISRALTNISLQSSLFTVLARHVPHELEETAARSLNIAVVCTKSDEIDLDTASEEFCGPGKSISATEMDALDQKIADAQSGRNTALNKELKLRRKLMFIQARNENVTGRLRDAYRSRTRGGELEVFCVSSRLYGKYTQRGHAEAVRASAIPAVRRFCHTVSAGVQLREARHHLRSSLFGLVGSLHIWSSCAVRDGGETAGLEETRRLIDRALDVADSRLADAVSRFRKDFDECFREQIQDMQLNRQPEWESAAASEARKWEDWDRMQYKAWCLNDGNHSTPKRVAENWNAKIMWKMWAELAYQWDVVEVEIPGLFSALTVSVGEILAELKGTILDLCQTRSHGLIADAVESSRRQFSYQSNLSQQRFLQEFRLVRRYASESNHSSYVLGEMLPAYRDAKSQHGDGMAARQRAIIRGRINDGALFPNISFAIAEQVGAIAEVEQAELRGATRRVVAQVRGEAELVLVAPMQREREVRSAESARRLTELAEVVEGLRVDLRDMEEALEEDSS